MSRDEFSRGTLALRVTVRGSAKDDPTPKGTLQLMSETEVVADEKTNDKGVVAFQKEALTTGPYDLRLRFTPEDRDEWATVDEPMKGLWQVIPMVGVKVDLEETKALKDRLSKLRFKVGESSVAVRDLPPGKPYFLQFRPRQRPITGTLTSQFEMSETGNAKLNIRWKPGNNSWDKGKVIAKVPAFPVITVIVAEPMEKKTGDNPSDKKDGAVKYTLNNAFPPTHRDDRDAYLPLVASFRKVVGALHGAEIEVYEGIDTKYKVLGFGGMFIKKTVRERKDPDALPLLRLKLLDQN